MGSARKASLCYDPPTQILYRQKCWHQQPSCIVIALIVSRSQRVSLIVIPFCLSVCLDVCWSFRDLQPTTITTKFGQQVSLDLCKLFWIPYPCQREKYAKFRLFPTHWQWVTQTLLVLQFVIEFANIWHNTLHRHTHRLTSAFLICTLMSNWQPFNTYSFHCERDASCHMTCSRIKFNHWRWNWLLEIICCKSLTA